MWPARKEATAAITAALTAVVLCSGLLGPAVTARAEEDIDEEEPIPSSVNEIVSPMERIAEMKPLRPGLFPWLKEQTKDYPPFIRDTRLVLNLRSFYQRRSYYDQTYTESLAAGSSLSYTSGWLYDRISAGAVLYTSQPVHAPEGHGGGGLLTKGQEGITVLGQLYGRVKLFERSFLNLYRYGEFNSPYLSKNDSKMIPYTFEGYTIQGVLGGEESDHKLTYGGGYIARIKDKTSDRFIWMSEKAGAEAKRGVAALGGRYTLGGFSIGAIDYYSDDIINIGFAEATYTRNLTENLGIRIAAQYTDQRSTGSNLLTGTRWSTRQAGVKADVSYRSGIISLAYTANSRGRDLVNPWSGYPGYTSSMITDFKKAGINALLTRFSYDFSRLGLEGVAAYAQFTHGWGMVDQTTREHLPNENEFDADLQWRPQGGYLKGLWVRGRYGVVHQYQGEKKYSHDCRVIVNYDFPLM